MTVGDYNVREENLVNLICSREGAQMKQSNPLVWLDFWITDGQRGCQLNGALLLAWGVKCYVHNAKGCIKSI